MTARPSPSSSETAADPVHSFPPDKQRPTTVRQQTTDLLLPSPFPPLSLMHDTTQTVTHALAQSQLAAGAERAAKGKGKAEAVPPASGEAAASHTTKTRRWKAGLAPGQAAKKLFPKPNALVRAHRRFFIKRDLKYGREWTREELDEAAARGNFPYRPSDLFLKMYSDVLTTLTRDPLAGNVSPSLIGTQGTIPLSVISTIPDIMQHYKDCILLAEKEIFLVTNYWQPSDSVNAVSSGLRELNERVQKRSGEKIVVKIMWDRGAIQQLWHNHVYVTPETWTPLGLPHPDEVPHLSLQVVNFHRPLLGTFHQKSMVVDRKIALLNSNNIQDRPNLEMMIHLEGPVVDSIYDNMLISWNEPFSPSLPLLNAPSPTSHPKLFPYSFSDLNPFLANIDVAKAAKAARILLKRQDERAKAGEQNTSLSPPDWWRRESVQPGTTPTGEGSGEAEGGKLAGLVMHLVEKAREEKARLALGMERGLSGILPGHEGEGQQRSGALSSRPSTSGARPAAISSTTAPVPAGRTSIADSGFEGGGKGSSEEKRLGTMGGLGAPLHSEPFHSPLHEVTAPAPDSPPLVPAQTDSQPLSQATRDPSPPGMNEPDAPPPTGDSLPHLPPNTTSTNPAEASPAPSTGSGSGFKGTATSARLQALSKALNAGALTKIEAAFDDETLIHDFKPHMLHKQHEAFPIALVNRRPHGSPGHADLRCPQDAAWLASLRYAEKNVFIQTPTLNAKPLVRGIIEACTSGGLNRQGIPITLYLGLGFNDKGESIPFQGGTNEQVVFRLYAALRAVRKEGNLHVYWYTGKDQIRPHNAIFKSRNCHIKFLAVDGQCAVVGNGNMDSQSFWHSQEANVLVDSPQLVADWMDQLQTNQSTHKYGRVDTDGIWRDPATGEELEKPKAINCFTAMRAVI